MKDLVVLVADTNMQYALRGALARPEALGIRTVNFDFRTHMGRDGGARTTGAEMLALERRRFAYALLMFDLEGCGADPGQTAEDLESALDEQLGVTWGAHAKSIAGGPVELGAVAGRHGRDSAHGDGVRCLPAGRARSRAARQRCRRSGHDRHGGGAR